MSKDTITVPRKEVEILIERLEEENESYGDRIVSLEHAYNSAISLIRETFGIEVHEYLIGQYLEFDEPEDKSLEEITFKVVEVKGDELRVIMEFEDEDSEGIWTDIHSVVVL